MKFYYAIFPIRDHEELTGDLVAEYNRRSSILHHQDDPRKTLVDQGGRVVEIFPSGAINIVARDQDESEFVRKDLDMRLKRINSEAYLEKIQ